MAVRLIREKDVVSLVGIEDALAAVEAAFIEQAQGTGVNEPRRRVRQSGGTLHLMGAALSRRGYWGFKAYTSTRKGTHFLVNLYAIQSGELLSIIEADTLGRLRTGAATGVATKYLARPDSEVMALIGSGSQAQTQLAAVNEVRALKSVRVYSRTYERSVLFAERLSGELGVDIVAVQTPGEAVIGADIVTTITTSTDPVFDGDDLGEGTHINAAGSNAVIRAELDRKTMRRADRIFTDDLQQAHHECGNLVRAFEGNALSWGRVRPLADVVAELTLGRRNVDEITLFLSHGIALWDIALAADIYERAEAKDVGEVVEFGD